MPLIRRSINMHRFGEKLRTLRQRRRLTLQELAAAFGMQSHGHLGQIERGAKVPSAELILQIARFFQVSLDRLMLDEQDLLPEDGRERPLPEP